MGNDGCGLAVAAACLAVITQSAGVALPDTPQGALAAQYLRVFNSGDEQAMQALLRERMTDAMRARRTDDERRKAFQQLRERLGNVEVAEVTISQPARLDFVVTAQTRLRAIYTITFDTSTPPRFDSIAVEIRVPEG
jgi:hypothetical protein